MADLQLAEAKIKSVAVSPDSARHLYSLYEIQILDKHKVTPEKYVQSYQYYIENHRLMTRVHQAVLDTLLARQTKIESLPDTVLEKRIQALRKRAAVQDTVKKKPSAPDSLQKDTTNVDFGGAKPMPRLFELDQDDRPRKILRKKKDN